MTDKQKQDARKKGKQAARKAAEKSKATGLKWWERLIWIVLAGLAGAACSALTGCGQLSRWEELSPEQQQAFQAADHAFHRWSGASVPGVVTVTEGDK